MIKSRLYFSVAILFLLFIALTSGIFLQKYHIPGRILRHLIIQNQSKDYRDYSEVVDQKLINLFGKPAEIYDSNSYFIYTTEPEKSSEGVRFLSYRYYWHYKEIADYLVSNEIKQVASKIHNDFWRVEADSISEFLEAMEPKRKFLKETLGIQDLPPNGRVKNSSIVLHDDTLEIKKVKLESRIKPISVPLYIAKPRNIRIKGVVIAIHGNLGAPEKVIGIEPRDYTRRFGAELAKSGYIVYAPYVLSIGDRHANISALGRLYSQSTSPLIDLQKLLSVVDNIKNDPELSELPLVTFGISYGGRLSLMLGSIDRRIDLVISSGSMQHSTRLGFEHSYALDKNVTDSFGNIYFTYSDFVKLIYPRPFIIEYGAFDHQAGSVSGSIKEWQAIERIFQRHNMTRNLKLIWFRGYHESAPQLTIPVLDYFVEKLNGD